MSAETRARSPNLAEYLQWRDPSVARFAPHLMYDPLRFTELRFIVTVGGNAVMVYQVLDPLTGYRSRLATVTPGR
jgi:hypothetical protein